jgi:hypothetical protein
MKRFAVSFLILASFAGSAALADDSCKMQAAAKSLHGAAETSFLKKCASDAKTKCQADAKAKNLHGAAQTSFVNKCAKDASGA